MHIPLRHRTGLLTSCAWVVYSPMTITITIAAVLPETSIYASERVVLALPEGAGCGPNFCWRLVDATSCFCQRLPEVAKNLAGD